MLRVDGISGGYGPLRVVNDVSFEVNRGEIVALLGPNGAGKSTTLRLVVGLLPMVAGSKTMDDHDLSGLPPHRIARLGLGLVPEGRWLFPEMTVRENLLVGGYKLAGRREREVELARVLELFPGLAARTNARAGSMSGGEQQMCAIARALMMSPTYLLLDEPSLGLAPIVVKQVYSEVARLQELGIGVLVVEQNVELVLGLAARGYVMREGRIIASGDSQTLLEGDVIRSEYMGAARRGSADGADGRRWSEVSSAP
jgi:branched-chain amino acid transport system ATP-binding protein